MVGIALFSHEDAIHAHGNISKDGVGKIVDAVGVSGIVGIGIGQIAFQSIIPIGRISQTYFYLKTEFVEIIIIFGGRDGKRDGLYSRQGRLKRHVPGGFVPVIHIRDIKQIERHVFFGQPQVHNESEDVQRRFLFIAFRASQLVSTW